MKRAGQQHRALDGLRGLCACMVVLYHLRTIGWVANLPVVHNGFLFVDFFFVLSGFVIAHGYRARIAAGFPIWRFMGLRLGRVYPLHLAMLVPLVAIEALALRYRVSDRVPFTFPNGTADLARTVTFTQVFHYPSRAWNIPAWSIAAEIWTYLLFAVLFRLLPRPRVLVGAAVALACMSLVPIALFQPLYMDAEGLGSLWRCFCGFGCGAAASLLSAGKRRSFGTIGGVVVLGLCVAFVSLAGVDWLSLAAPAVFTGTVLVFASEQGAASRLLCSRAAQALGRLSYSIYMVHWLIVVRFGTALKLVDHHWGTDLLALIDEHTAARSIAGDLVSAGVLAAVIALAALAYGLIERPGQRWSRRLFLPPEPAALRRIDAAEQDAPAF